MAKPGKHYLTFCSMSRLAINNTQSIYPSPPPPFPGPWTKHYKNTPPPPPYSLPYGPDASCTNYTRIQYYLKRMLAKNLKGVTINLLKILFDVSAKSIWKNLSQKPQNCRVCLCVQCALCKFQSNNLFGALPLGNRIKVENRNR